MSGPTEISELPFMVIALTSAVALVTDLARKKIYNWLVIPVWFVGMFYSYWAGGWHGLGGALGASLIAFIGYGWMYWSGVMGAGDIKFLMALGAWGGTRFTLETAILGVLLGGAMAILILLVRGRALQFARKIYRFILTLFIKELETEFPQVDRKLKMPFGVAIAIAAVWTAWSSPISRWGLLP